MKDPFIVRVAPDKELEHWKVIPETGKATPQKGLTKKQAVKLARKLVERKARPAIVLVHKTRYIVERSLQFAG